MSFPMRLPTHTASGGRNLGAQSRTITSITTDAPTSSGWPSNVAPVTITIAGAGREAHRLHDHRGPRGRDGR